MRPHELRGRCSPQQFERRHSPDGAAGGARLIDVADVLEQVDGEHGIKRLLAVAPLTEQLFDDRLAARSSPICGTPNRPPDQGPAVCQCRSNVVVAVLHGRGEPVEEFRAAGARVARELGHAPLENPVLGREL